MSGWPGAREEFAPRPEKEGVQFPLKTRAIPAEAVGRNAVEVAGQA